MDYLLEALGDDRFQKLCQALLSHIYPDTQCLPVNQPDGGRDGFQRVPLKAKFNVFQVKYSKNPGGADERKSVESLIDSEEKKVQSLVQRGAGAYFLLTNVAGTAHLDVGSIDKVNSKLSEAFGIPTYCWWRDDIERRIDTIPQIKWSFPEILRATDLLEQLINAPVNAGAKRREGALKAYMTHQAGRDAHLKFKQVDLEKGIVDLFVDVPSQIEVPPAENERTHKIHWAQFFREQQLKIYRTPGGPGDEPSVGALELLVNQAFGSVAPRLVIEGAPGQGKSTVTQFLCQVHRLYLLGRAQEIAHMPDEYKPKALRIPFRIDLRDYATWLAQNDYVEETVTRGRQSLVLERFIADEVSHATGYDFSVADFSEVIDRAFVLVVLDGFDEVVDIKTRNLIVKEVSESTIRLGAVAKSVQLIVTSRPSAFANSPGFSRDEWLHLNLLPLPSPVIEQYAIKWLDAKAADERERKDILAALAEKITQPHVRDLARNPMQLAILLALISIQGASLPDKRTALYDEYIGIFLNRESEKSPVVRGYRELLLGIHRYLAWLLQTGAERSKAGNISEADLKKVIRNYLEENCHSTELLEQLFNGVVERVVVLVSRVQGTFEFEVQPLREYFAARYLYDTAPYIQAGVPSRAGKVERFNALAKNFYWFNVTRFYAGCYNSGELSSLVHCIEDLSDLDGYSETGFPARLGLSLLNDFVFSQQPRIARRLSDYLATNRGLWIHLAETTYRASEVIAVPSLSGEPVRLALQGWLLNKHLDVQAAASRSYVYNSNFDERLSLWWSFKGRKNWLALGHNLRVFREMPTSSAVELVNSCGFDAFQYLLIEDRMDVLEFFPDLWLQVVEGVMDGDYYLSPSPKPPKNCLIVQEFSQRLACVLAPYVWDEVGLEDYQQDTLFGALQKIFYYDDSTCAASQDLIPEDRYMLSELLEQLEDIYQTPVSELLIDSSKFCRFVESISARWGHKWGVALAVVGYAEGFKGEFCSAPLDLWDISSSLVTRILNAARQRSVEWWFSQINGVFDRDLESQKLVVVCALRWMPLCHVIESSEELGRLVDNLGDTDWAEVSMGVEYRLGRPDSFDAAGTDRISERLSSRLTSLLFRRANVRGKEALWRRVLSNYDGCDRGTLFALSSHGFELAQRGRVSWGRALADIRRAYESDVSIHVSEESQKRKHSEIPLDVAKLICGEAELYPLSLVGAAAACIRSDLGKKALPVSEVAALDEWFGWLN